MTETQAMDIEVYVQSLPQPNAVEWLQSVFPVVEPQKKRKGMPKGAFPTKVRWQENEFLVIIFENVIPGYTSIWLDSSTLPWEDDEQCGLELAKALNKNVRVTAGGWQQNADPDAWLELTPDGAKNPIIWKT